MRVVLNVEDELEATLAMDRLKMEAIALLDEEEGDSVEVTQLIPFTTDNLAPEEILVNLKKTRNILIRTRIRDCYDLASALDQTIHTLQAQIDPSYINTYDYGRMLSFAERILKHKEDPTE
jgi:hypothetical protein